MKNLVIRLLLLPLLVVSTGLMLIQCENGQSRLAENFTNPPGEYRPGAFWCWLNGDMTRESITRDLKEMSEKGMGRAEIWDVAAVNNPDNYIGSGPAFMSDSSVALIKHAFDEGRKYGIKLGMVGSSGWNAGGAWVEPEWASKQLFYSELIVSGPINEKLALPFPEVPRRCPKDANGMPVFYNEVAVLAMPVNDEKRLNGTNEVIDLSDSFADGYLAVDLPEGDWNIMRFICSNNGQMLIVPSPKSNGLFIDFLDPESTKRHLKHFMERLEIKKGVKRDGGLTYIEFDSMELAEGISWTDSMPSVFKTRRGYDLTLYLPILAGWTITGETERFLYDWKKAISDQLIFSHYTTGREFLKGYNIDLVAEAGGPGPPTWSTCPVDALKALGNVSVPRGEFWVRHRDIFLVKEVASAAHIYGRRVVDAESFTTWRRWKDSPYDLKLLVDRAFCEGLNCVTFHTFASTRNEDGLPGRTYHAGSDINHANTWWDKSGPFMDYLARCSYMLQQGLFVADAAYYYGDQAPNFWPAYHVVPEKIIPKDLGEGYDYDVVNSDVILNRMSVEDGRIILPDGLSYAVLVLPDQDHIPLDVLKKLETLVRNGATVIGNRPAGVPYLHRHQDDDKELLELVDLMWQDIDGQETRISYHGEGRVISGMSTREVLLADGIVPDFVQAPSGSLDYIHRKDGEHDIFFVRNKSDQPYSGNCSFRVSGKQPEYWDPGSGNRYLMKQSISKDDDTIIHLDLEAGASAFIVFTNTDGLILPLWEGSPVPEKEIKMDGQWRLTFPEGWGAPEEIILDTLISWTESDLEGVRYFSGTATYHNKFPIDANDLKNRRVELTVGEVRDVAEVFLNGVAVGILWKNPWVIDVTDFVQAGENELRIEVVNQWVNRLSGDMLLDPEDRFCRTNQPYKLRDDQGYDNWIGNSDETFRPQKSGLLGPVGVLIYQEK